MNIFVCLKTEKSCGTIRTDHLKDFYVVMTTLGASDTNKGELLDAFF